MGIIFKDISASLTPEGPVTGAIRPQDIQWKLTGRCDLRVDDKGNVASWDSTEPGPGDRVVDLSRYSQILAMPAFVDPHTHALHGGHRSAEFWMRARGESYLDIAAAGGGIASTVAQTRAASDEELERQLSRTLFRMSSQGVATVEVKASYGLSTEQELRGLAIIDKVRQDWPQRIVPTFMGAHAVPAGVSREFYVEQVIQEMLPAVKEQGIAEFVDIFTDRGAFSLDESRRIMTAAKDLGFALRFHADEFESFGAVELAVELGAASVDHLIRISDESISALATAENTVATLLPATSLTLGEYGAPWSKLRDANVPVALGTDYNPGSSPCDSMWTLLYLAAVHLGMDQYDVLTAVTVNAAASLGLNVGRLAAGEPADILFVQIDDPAKIGARLGEPPKTAHYRQGKYWGSNIYNWPDSSFADANSKSVS